MYPDGTQQFKLQSLAVPLSSAHDERSRPCRAANLMRKPCKLNCELRAFEKLAGAVTHRMAHLDASQDGRRRPSFSGIYPASDEVDGWDRGLAPGG
jgi:hypothetical protein